VPVVIGERQSECDFVFIKRAEEMGSPLIFASDNFAAEFLNYYDAGQTLQIRKNGKIFYERLQVDLTGRYQLKNVCTVLQSVEILKDSFPGISESSVSGGLKNILSNTKLLGRWQVIGRNPLIIADVGHNEAGMLEVVNQLKIISHRQLHIVFGVVKDKNINSMLKILPVSANYYFCKADLPRALDADELRRLAVSFSLNGNSYTSVKEALSSARRQAGPEDLIFIGGSSFVVAEAI
jgi:dihydrofolate synthase/folylpolyglutamate synthase